MLINIISFREYLRQYSGFSKIKNRCLSISNQVRPSSWYGTAKDRCKAGPSSNLGSARQPREVPPTELTAIKKTGDGPSRTGMFLNDCTDAV
jgi:hypothetical protein